MSISAPAAGSTDPSEALQAVLNTLQPELQPGAYAFVSVPPDCRVPWADVIASIREREGLSLVVPRAVAERERWRVLFDTAWITLTLQTDLSMCGLTAAFARAAAERGIACNVVAGALHDHLFVPLAQAHDAMDALRSLRR